MIPDIDSLHIVSPEITKQTIDETEVIYAVDLGAGVSAHFGLRENRPVWIIDNPNGELGVVLYDAGD